jgi:hypothetical protein
MKKINLSLVIILNFLLISCSAKEEKNKLIIPPNFAEIPDLNNIEEVKNKESNNEEIVKLKELLLEND